MSSQEATQNLGSPFRLFEDHTSDEPSLTTGPIDNKENDTPLTEIDNGFGCSIKIQTAKESVNVSVSSGGGVRIVVQVGGRHGEGGALGH